MPMRTAEAEAEAEAGAEADAETPSTVPCRARLAASRVRGSEAN